MRILTSAIATVLLLATTAAAQITSISVNKCLHRKLLEVRKTAAADIRCHAGFAASDDQARYLKCKSQVELKFTGGDDPSRGRFEKIETKLAPNACLTYDDQHDMFYFDIWERLTTHLSFTIPGLGKACDAKKMTCARKYTAASVKCYADATRQQDGGLVSSSCLAEAADAFIGSPTSCLERANAEYGPSCTSTSPVNSNAIRDIVDYFSEHAVCRVDPGNPACPTPTPTTTRTPTRTPTPTPTETPTPLPTSTVPGVCGNGLVEYAEYCDPPGVGPCGPAFACTACSCACPSTIDFVPDAASPDTVLDLGWNGIGHQQPVVTNGGMTLAVSGCAGTSRPCGVCNLTGPILSTDADAGALHNRRCTNDTSIKCADDAPCLAGGGTCALFFGSNLPFSAGGVGACLVSRFNGPVSGTLNVESGALAADVALAVRVYSSWLTPGLADHPCPRCVGDGAPNDGTAGGTCDAGPRAGLACDANGAVPGRPDFGTPSLECPPDPSLLVGTLPLRFASLTTDATTKSLSANSPNCSSPGPPQKCYCDTCNNANAEPCSSNADCPTSGGNPGLCGGRRCLAGGNVGNPCTVNSACPGGSCGRPGEPTKLNGCVDDCAGNGFCVDEEPVGDGRAECLVGFQPPYYFGGGPSEGRCSNHPQRLCWSDGDCDGVSGACGSPTPRRCFQGGGYIGGQITALGHASAPVGDVASPTLAAIACIGPSSSPALNIANGIPGPARITLEGTLTAHP